MTIKTPQEIAAEQMRAFTVDDGDVQECSAAFIAEQIAAAIEADRKQRDIYELIAEALEDRAAGWDENEDADFSSPSYRAAQALRDGAGDTAWDDHIGPMLDRMEQEYGA